MTISPTTLWSPNHRLQPISIATIASDLCDEYPYVVCSASSNEAPLALGSGHTESDIEWIDGQLYVRAERSGTGTGRIYTVECTAYDASGNARTNTATVTVPHDSPN